jgi:DNA-binding YbaB/EbfC family protein
MAIFGKAKEQLDFVKKAREIQKKLKAITIEGESGPVKITMNGEQKIQSVVIDREEFDPEDVRKLEKDIASAIESANSKFQKVSTDMMKDMGGLGFPGM